MALCSNAKSWRNAEFWVDDWLRPYKHMSWGSPSHILIVGLSTRVDKQPYCNSTCFLAVNSFLQLLDYIITIFRKLICQTRILGSVVRVLCFESGDCLFCSKQCAFALVAMVTLACHHFLNLMNPNHLFSQAMIDCLREAKSLLLIGCVNKSFFIQAIQLFKKLRQVRLKWDFRTYSLDQSAMQAPS